MAEKIKAWIKEVKLAASVVKILISVIASLSLVVPVLQGIVRQEVAPITGYINNDIAKLITKSAEKIKSDPFDVKMADIEMALNYWPMLKESDMVNKAALEQKIIVLKDWLGKQYIKG